MYQLLDSGEGLKLEAFGRYKIIRPCGIALWPKSKPKLWRQEHIDAIFTREDKEGWVKNKLPGHWDIELFSDVKMRLRATEFGHVGVFPEHVHHFPFMEEAIKDGENLRVLNLFAYSGLTTAFLGVRGCFVTHVDASKPIILWAKENMGINGLASDSVRWITDDAVKFVEREKRRGKSYDAIILDPPSFGRGAQGQVFKIEQSLEKLVTSCLDLLSEQARFFVMTNHTPGFTPLFLTRYFQELAHPVLKGGHCEVDEMYLGSLQRAVPMGSYYRWRR